MGFNIGDRVVCVDDSNHSYNGVKSNLKKGREYIIYGMKNICNCGLSFDVGITKSVVTHINSYCPMCGDIYKDTSIHYAFATRFRKVEERKEYRVVKSEIEIKESCLS